MTRAQRKNIPNTTRHAGAKPLDDCGAGGGLGAEADLLLSGSSPNTTATHSAATRARIVGPFPTYHTSGCHSQSRSQGWRHGPEPSGWSAVLAIAPPKPCLSKPAGFLQQCQRHQACSASFGLQRGSTCERRKGAVLACARRDRVQARLGLGNTLCSAGSPARGQPRSMGP